MQPSSICEMKAFNRRGCTFEDPDTLRFATIAVRSQAEMRIIYQSQRLLPAKRKNRTTKRDCLRAAQHHRPTTTQRPSEVFSSSPQFSLRLSFTHTKSGAASPTLLASFCSEWHRHTRDRTSLQSIGAKLPATSALIPYSRATTRSVRFSATACWCPSGAVKGGRMSPALILYFGRATQSHRSPPETPASTGRSVDHNCATAVQTGDSQQTRSERV